MEIGQTNARNETNEKTETREQTIRKIEFYIPSLTDSELRLAVAFIRGMKKRD